MADNLVVYVEKREEVRDVVPATLDGDLGKFAYGVLRGKGVGGTVEVVVHATEEFASSAYGGGECAGSADFFADGALPFEKVRIVALVAEEEIATDWEGEDESLASEDRLKHEGTHPVVAGVDNCLADSTEFFHGSVHAGNLVDDITVWDIFGVCGEAEDETGV